MRLDIFDLQLVLNIVSMGSLTQGAQRSAISLQAASERIKKIEQHFAVQLFTRHASGVRLTTAGQTFVTHAEELVAHAEALQRAMLPFSKQAAQINPPKIEMTLWCNSSAQSEYLPLLLPQYLVENAQTHIELKEAETQEIIQALQQGTAQLGLISSFFEAKNLATLVFSDDPLVLICPIAHPLTAKSQLSLVECLPYAFVGLMSYHSLQQSIEAQAQQLGCAIQYRLRLPNFAAIAQVVASGVGIAIMPKRAARRLAEHFAFSQIELLGAWANRQLLLAAQNFEQLPMCYQHLSQFLRSQHELLSLNEARIKSSPTDAPPYNCQK